MHMTTMAPPKLIDWTDQLSVGVPSIDSQHRKLIDLINDLHAAMAAGRGAELLGKTFKGLVHYTLSHFAYEEQLMRQTAFPGLEAHRAEHTRLVDTVQKLQQDWRSGKVAISMEMLWFLKDWVGGHIVGMDKKYGPHVTAAGAR